MLSITINILHSYYSRFNYLGAGTDRFLCASRTCRCPKHKRRVKLFFHPGITDIPNMFNKLLNVHKLTPFSRRVPPKPAAPAQPQPEEAISSVLKIVHVGGRVESYYMAIPAVRIMEKYPSFLLARPEVFRRPWDSVVRPDRILTPGEKFYVVPRHTIKKLLRKIKKPDREVSNSFASQSSINTSVSQRNGDFSSKSFLKEGDISDSSEVSGSFISAFKKKSSIKKHVKFVGIEVKQKASSYTVGKKSKEEDNSRKSLNNQSRSQSHRGKRRARNAAAWQPSLRAICERNDE